ncbi:dUTP diphosphatase [Paenibacillus glucanolyticus]|uniref:dUTP diphosphatase n=1 Tax=Paenibacillus glucanolyticus TaxID=59843 RepID=UPI00128D8641|nr:dUTP diphosphatase [Paenibacillus glucanolyticus]MPY20684.1 dUTPase [Paenibacillus glucanolyticus]
MTLTIEQMYEMQKELDTKIIKEKGLEGQDLLPNTVLALQVEIGELANEWRGFKHWSNDRDPRTRIVCMMCHGIGEIYQPIEGIQVICPHCDGDGRENPSNPLLEEYVDCLHFFLSIARQLDLPVTDLNIQVDAIEAQTAALFSELLNLIGVLNGQSFLINPEAVSKREYFRYALGIFFILGYQYLGFTFEQIAEAYAAKNAVNHQRQANGY